MLETLITSQTRIKLLIRFFTDHSNYGYLRGLSDEFGDSSNSIRLELNRFEKAGLLVSVVDGNKKLYKANEKHPLFFEIKNLVQKYLGIDKIVDRLAGQLQYVDEIWITGEYYTASYKQTSKILLIGNKLDNAELLRIFSNVKSSINRKLNFVTIKPEDKYEYLQKNKTKLLIWSALS